MLELAQLVISETGSKSEIIFGPLPSDDPTQRCPDISRARALLGWDPLVDLSRGLRETVRYFRELREGGLSRNPPSHTSIGWIVVRAA